MKKRSVPAEISGSIDNGFVFKPAVSEDISSNNVVIRDSDGLLNMIRSWRERLSVVPGHPPFCIDLNDVTTLRTQDIACFMKLLKIGAALTIRTKESRLMDFFDQAGLSELLRA